ncbi:hypothetical protein D3C86_1804820 [compost metagenome]
MRPGIRSLPLATLRLHAGNVRSSIIVNPPFIPVLSTLNKGLPKLAPLDLKVEASVPLSCMVPLRYWVFADASVSVGSNSMEPHISIVYPPISKTGELATLVQIMS